jgi:hypothetical protein
MNKEYLKSFNKFAQLSADMQKELNNRALNAIENVKDEKEKKKLKEYIDFCNSGDIEKVRTVIKEIGNIIN